MSKIVIITGALGFIGQNIARKFKLENYYVIGIGHGVGSNTFLRDNGIDEWINADLDIASLKSIKKKAHLIIHCAGGSTVGISLENPYLDYHKTVNSTLELLEFVRLYSSDTNVIYLSSAAVYGVKNDSPILETDSTTPISPYGFHKLASENICMSYASCFGINVSVIRLFSIYGNGLKKQLIWDAVNKMITGNDQVSFFGTGDETRDWLHINDAVDLIYHLSKTVKGFSIYNGATGRRVKLFELTSILSNTLKLDNSKIVFDKRIKEGDPKYYLANIDKAIENGWEPKISLEDGLSEYVNWFKSIL